MPKAAAKTRKVVKTKTRPRPAGLVAKAEPHMQDKIDRRARFSEELKAQAVALAREGKVTREIGTALGLDKAQWQNIRLWTEKANVALPKERKREQRAAGKRGQPAAGSVQATVRKAAPLRLASEPADPLASILDLLENPGDAIATLQAERSKAVQRLATIDKLLAVLLTKE
jgi:transposase-like protein